MSPVMHMCRHDHSVTVAVCVCITFRSVHVVIENVNASHMHPICISFYQVYGACKLITLKGVYGTVCDCERINRGRICVKNECELIQQKSFKHTANAIR